MGSLDFEFGAIFDEVIDTLTRMGHRLEMADLPLAGADGAVRDDRARAERRLPVSWCHPTTGTSSGSQPREVVADGERMGTSDCGVAARRRVAAPLRCSTRWRRSSSSSRPCSRGRPCRWTSSRWTPAAARSGGRTSSGTPTPCPSTSRASRRSRCPAAPPRRVSRSACRSPGRQARTRSYSASQPRSSGRARVERRRPGNRRGLRPDRGRRSWGLGANRACLDRIRERDGEQSHEATRARSTPGCACTGTMPSRRPTAPTHGSPRATRRSSAGIPIGLKDLYAVAGKPLTASSRLLDERAGRSLRRLGAAARRRAWSCSAICTRTSSPSAGRPTRSATRGRSTARPAARAAARRAALAARMCRPRRARTPPARCASPPRSAGTSTIKPTRGPCRCAASSRSRRRSTSRADGAHASRTARCWSPAWPADWPRARGSERGALRRAGAQPLRVRLALSPGSSSSTPMSPKGSTPGSSVP